MSVKSHQVCLAHLFRNAEYLNELDTKQDWSRRFIHLIAHAIDLRRNGNITQRKIKQLLHRSFIKKSMCYFFKL